VSSPSPSNPLSAYLERIAYRGPRDATVATLRALHLAHLYAVPFENLDIHLGQPIVLDQAALFDKIVTRRRGGFCYELNGMFCALLRALGFRVTMLAAGVAHETGGYGPEFDHMTLRVDLDEPWLADVGFGQGFRLPLRLNETAPQEQDGYAYRIIGEGGYRVLQGRAAEGAWKPQYRFTPQPHVLSDYGECCLYHQTSPQSHFTQNRICTLATPDGRITLSGMRLIITSGAEKTERTLADAAEYAAVLRDLFGVVE